MKWNESNESVYKDGREELSKWMNEIITKSSSSPDREIIKKWRSIVGDKLYHILKYVKTEKGTLYVEVNDNIYKSVVLMSKKDIIDNFNTFFPSRKVSRMSIIVIY